MKNTVIKMLPNPFKFTLNNYIVHGNNFCRTAVTTLMNFLEMELCVYVLDCF